MALGLKTILAMLFALSATAASSVARGSAGLVSGEPCLKDSAGQETQNRIEAFIKGQRAKIGVAWIKDGNLMSVNGSRQYPLMSVFKLHVAVTALRKMERQGTSLDTLLYIKAGTMRKDTYSPLLKLHPDSDFSISMRELMRYSVAESDNNACDILIDYAGGTEAVSREMRSIGLDGFCITETEASMHADISRCRNNSSTPGSVAELLREIYEGGILTGDYARYIKETLFMTTTGADKMKAGLPPGMKLGHKTGSSDRTPQGVKIGDNDAGAVIMPDGKHCYIAVFIEDSAESDATNAAIIAGITKIILTPDGCPAATY